MKKQKLKGWLHLTILWRGFNYSVFRKSSKIIKKTMSTFRSFIICHPRYSILTFNLLSCSNILMWYLLLNLLSYVMLCLARFLQNTSKNLHCYLFIFLCDDVIIQKSMKMVMWIFLKIKFTCFNIKKKLLNSLFLTYHILMPWYYAWFNKIYFIICIFSLD